MHTYIKENISFHSFNRSSIMAHSLVTQEDCENILEKYYNSRNFGFINYKVKPISDIVEGIQGEHYNLIITFEQDGKVNRKIFFIKTKLLNANPETNIQALMIESCNSYNKEIFFYDILINEFHKFGYNTNFVPKCYFCVPNRTLILENLIDDDFVHWEKQTYFDLITMKSVLKTLAILHGSGFAYQENSNVSLEKKYADVFEERFFIMYINPKSINMRWWNNGMKTINYVIDLLPENEKYKEDLKCMFKKFPFGKIFLEDTKFAKTFSHGDLWTNNMLFKFNEDSIDCRLIDFQFCRYFYPNFDVLLAIYANTDSDFRKLHLQKLYQFYYDELREILTTYGCSIENILPLKDFYDCIRLTKADALLQVLCAVFLLYLPQEILTNSFKDDATMDFEKVVFNNTDLCCEAFTTNTKYCKIVSDVLYDLRETLIDVTNDL